jgi:hypothetical protein
MSFADMDGPLGWARTPSTTNPYADFRHGLRAWSTAENRWRRAKFEQESQCIQRAFS